MVMENREQATRVEEERAERDRQLCLNAIGSSIRECQYKKSLETAKEYIDFLFRSSENMNIIRGRTVEFITGLAAMGEGHSSEVQSRLQTALERFRLRFDLQSSSFEVAGVAEEMLNVIFAELESRQLYSGDDLKKVLNYIDRNIKRGVTLDMAAAYVGMSASYFSKFFKKYVKSVTSQISGAVNDAYLQSQGTAGRKSYGMVVDLTVAYLKSNALIEK
jgi:YesN/AraC family two-component response regulator